MVSKHLLRTGRKSFWKHRRESSQTPQRAHGGRRAPPQICAWPCACFSQRGFRGHTTKEIPPPAGVSEAMVFRHFDQEELYSAILDSQGLSSRDHGSAANRGRSSCAEDDRAVFEGLALDALNSMIGIRNFTGCCCTQPGRTTTRPDVLGEICEAGLSHAAHLHRERQRDGAIVEGEPLVIVRAFVG